MLETLATIAIAVYAVIEAELQRKQNLDIEVPQIADVAMGHSVTASTSWDGLHMPDRAYLNFKSENGCQSWCSRNKNNSHWLQVNFGGQRQLVTEVATQGRGDQLSGFKKVEFKWIIR